MSITREQVTDLQPGDVVELSWPTTSGHEGVSVTARGPLHSMTGGLTRALFLGCYCVRNQDGDPVYGDRRTLTVVSRAPRLYVNHPRTEPVAGDVVAAPDDDGEVLPGWRPTWARSGEGIWISTHTGRPIAGAIRDRLRLLVDGETGRCVP